MALELIALLSFLALYAGAVEELVEQVKPWLTMVLPKDSNGAVDANLYLGAVKLSRFGIAFFALLITEAAPKLVELFPLLASIPLFAVLIIGAAITGLGASTIHTVLDFIRALVNRVQPPVTAIVAEAGTEPVL